MTILERFRNLIAIQPGANGCWVWQGAPDKDGYGLFWDGETTVQAHRWSYAQAHGGIPPDHVLDHLCKRHACVRPAHLQPVPTGVNTRRGMSPAAINARKTHCKSGHPFTPANTYRPPSGERLCRICLRQATQRYHHAHPERATIRRQRFRDRRRAGMTSG